MQTIELFCGTKSFSKVAAELGHDTFTCDNNPSMKPDVLGDINYLEAHEFPRRPLMLWASPPCQTFSVLCIAHYWNKNQTPKSYRTWRGIFTALRTLDLIKEIQPTWWFVENPRGMLRKQRIFFAEAEAMGAVRRTVTYCQYGDTRMKPTDIWTNATWWKPKAVCKSGAPCHEPAGLGNRTTGTLGLRNAVERSRIPPQLFHEIFSQMPRPSLKRGLLRACYDAWHGRQATQSNPLQQTSKTKE